MQLLVFKYEEENHFNDLRTVEINGEIWFVAQDVCNLLEIQNSRMAIASLEEDEKLMYTIYTSGQNRKVNLINESGLYTLIFKSVKPSAVKFRKWVTKEVIPSIRKTGSYSSGIDRLETPNFVKRYFENFDRVDKDRFSVITELFIRLYGRFEHVGYKIPNKAITGKEIRPDVSVGKCFSAYLKTYHPEVADEFTMYSHIFPDGYEVEARQYPYSMLPIFIKYVDDVWIPQNAEKHFKERDIKALDYLPKLLKAS